MTRTTSSNPTVIDLRSDTVTQPSDAMRRAMAVAEVGDDVLDGDPTTRRLEGRVAELLGHEAALFMPSGTQANQVAIGMACSTGSEIILPANAHILHYEQAGASALWGAQLRTVATDDGSMPVDAVQALIRPEGPFHPPTAMVSIENTNNAAGGKVVSLDEMIALSGVAAEAGATFHIDGARLWNAAVALDIHVSEMATLADTVMVSLSKGLGAPVGSCLAGPAELLTAGVELRRRLGGGMRQSGILAAACLYGLDHNLDRLGEDHARAAAFAGAMSGHPVARVIDPDTNIVMFDLPPAITARAAQSVLRDAGLLCSVFGPHRIRTVWHLGLHDDDVERAAVIMGDVLGAMET